METKKMIWGNPEVDVQKFVPSEYCKVCFDLHCDVAKESLASQHPEPGLLAWGEDSNGSHHKKYFIDGVYSGCGYDKNQVIRIDDSGNVSVVEINVPTHSGQYACTFTSPDNLTAQWLQDNPKGTLRWETTVGGRTYLHHGWAIWLSEGNYNPNHS